MAIKSEVLKMFSSYNTNSRYLFECPSCFHQFTAIMPSDGRYTTEQEDGARICPHCGNEADMVEELEQGEEHQLDREDRIYEEILYERLEKEKARKVG